MTSLEQATHVVVLRIFNCIFIGTCRLQLIDCDAMCILFNFVNGKYQESLLQHHGQRQHFCSDKMKKYSFF